MRVIAGELRGSRLDAPEGSTTRPITDRVKETLFNVLGVRLSTLAELPPVAVLDLFAGSGGLGIEALSRGAQRCLFVERDPAALRTLRTNIERLRLGERASVARENAWTMRVPPAEPDGYGLIFVDPPYRDATRAERVRDLLDRLGGRLGRGGLLVFRHGGGTDFAAMEYRNLRAADSRAYGDMSVLIFEAAAASDPPNGFGDAGEGPRGAE